MEEKKPNDSMNIEDVGTNIEGENLEEEYINLEDGSVQYILDDDGQIPDEEMGEQGEGNETKEEISEDSNPQDDSIQFFMHKDSVYSVSFHPSIPNIIATGGGDDLAFIWNTKEGKQLFELSGHKDSILSVRFNFDGKLLATASYDGSVKIWDPWTGSLKSTLDGPTDGIEWIEWHNKGNVIIGGSRDNNIWMWNVGTSGTSSTCMNVFAGHSAPITCGAFSNDGKQIISGSEDSSVRIWDPKNGTTINSFMGNWFHQGEILTLDVHPTSPLILTGSSDCTAKLLNISTGKVLSSFVHDDSVETVGFSKSNLPYVATGSLDETVKVWDLNTMQIRSSCKHEGGVTKLVWQNHLIFTISMDRKIRLWDSRNGKCEKIWMGHKDGILDIDINKEGTQIITGSDDHSALLFNIN